MRHWSLWDWIAFTCLWVTAVILAGDATIKLSPSFAAILPDIPAFHYVAFAPISLLAVATVIFVGKELGWLPLTNPRGAQKTGDADKTNGPKPGAVIGRGVETTPVQPRPVPVIQEAAKPNPEPEPKPKAKPRYEPDEIGKMLAAVRRFREILDKKIAPTYSDASMAQQSWHQNIFDTRGYPNSEKMLAFAEKMWNWQDTLQQASKEIGQVRAENQYYIDELNPVLRDENASLASIIDSSQRLRTDIAELAKMMGNIPPNPNTLLRFLESNALRWRTDLQNLGNWNGHFQKRIMDKTKELREWHND